MRKRTFLAYAVLVIGALASFVCYTRLSTLLPMRNEEAVSRAIATITHVQTPMLKKGEGGRDSVSRVMVAFRAQGQEVRGGFTTRGVEAMPAKGAKQPVVYLNKNPRIFLREAEYDALPRQLSVLRWMMISFALVALIVPFVILGTAKR